MRAIARWKAAVTAGTPCAPCPISVRGPSRVNGPSGHARSMRLSGMCWIVSPRHSDILDLGAGNGWLCHRAARRGHHCVALDMRDDHVDGLGAAKEFLVEEPGLFRCVTGSFEDLPFASESFDVTLFNASLHYAQDLRRALLEAIRVTRRGGILAILDSPFLSQRRRWRSDGRGEEIAWKSIFRRAGGFAAVSGFHRISHA